MKRHEKRFSHNRWGVAMMACMMGASSATAQFALPATLPSNDNPVAAPVAATTASLGQPAAIAGNQASGSAASYVDRARKALEAKDYQTAAGLYHQASALSKTDPAFRPVVARLQIDMQMAGVDLANLRRPTKITRIAAPAPGDHLAAKREALRLIAQGRASLDAGDVVSAISHARQAQALNVPESAFAAGEPRVWEFVLDAEAAAKRAGVNESMIALAGGSTTVQPGVMQPGAVQQSVFNGAMGAPGTGLAQVNNVVAAEGPVEAYQAGLTALEAGDTEGARAKFIEAWQNEAILDVATRQQLKDKLTLLQPTRMAPTAPAADIAVVDAETRQMNQRMFSEVSAELNNIAVIRESDPLDALDALTRLRRRVDSSQLTEASKQSLARMVDRELERQRQYVDANRAAIELQLENDSIKADMANDAALDQRVQAEIKQLAEEFSELMTAERFEEAEVIAKQVSELDPGSVIATQLRQTSTFSSRYKMLQDIKEGKEEVFAFGLMDVERSASDIAGYDPNRPMSFGTDPQEWATRSGRRLSERRSTFRSVQEAQLDNSLNTSVSVQYINRPLSDVIEDLSKVTNVPIVINARALAATRVPVDTPVTLNIQTPVSLRSALNLLLNDLGLAYDIDNEVIMVTSADAKNSRTYTRVYKVADLVTPIPNFYPSYENGLAGAIQAAIQMTQPKVDVQYVPTTAVGMNRNQGNLPGNIMGQYSPGAMTGAFNQGSRSQMGGAGSGGGAMADFTSLMNLIEQTIAPDAWENMGGSSTMAPYPQNLTLIVNTTSDVHKEIEDLLKSLRALQNLQITIELKFITLSDTFFEQIGVDFDLQFDDNVTELPRGEDDPPAVTIGWDGITGLPTGDLDIQFQNGSFGVNPAFGAPDPGALSTIGFAVLSDIEAFFFLQAAQGDERTNVMQAPKVTMFDGQTASVGDFTSRPFVTGIIPVVGDFAVAQQPVIVVLDEGTKLSVQGIVSEDRRFVRVTLMPQFSQIGDVSTFTFEGTRTTSSSTRAEEDTNGDGVVDELDAVDTEDTAEIVSGSTVQLPTLAQTFVNTTVNVPDGGTILLGGIKRLSEGRAERGVPMLGKIPYISRLFRNVAVGRDATSLMMMVTPRIIIQEEEEYVQTGFQADQ